MYAIKNKIKNHKHIKKLTVYPRVKYGFPKPVKNFRIEGDNLLIPRYYAYKNLELNIKPREMEHLETLTFNGELRDYQKVIINNIQNEFEKIPSCILNAQTGSGKTIIALKMISLLKVKTMIVVNKNILVEQFKKQIETFLPDAKVGLIQGSTFDEDCDINIAMLQTVSKGKYPRKKFKQFHFVIFDEVHNVSSEVFSNTLFLINSHYRLALSATPERNDKMEKIFIQHLGNTIKHEGSLKIIPNVHVYPCELNIIPETTVLGKTNMSKLTTDIALDLENNKKIVEVIKKYLENPDRNILILSNRVVQCKVINKLLGDVSGLFIGSMKTEETDETFKKRVIVATFSVAKEGFDLPKLNTLVLCSSVKSITQPIGRILRKQHPVDPIIVDFKYKRIGVVMNQYYFRMRHYRTNGYLIKNCEIADSECESDCESETMFLDETCE